MHILKPLDIVVALKIGVNEKSARLLLNEVSAEESIPISTNSVSDLSADLFKSKGDISRSIHRLIHLGLIGERQPRDNDVLSSNRKYYSVQRNALSDLLCNGVRHVFAPEKVGYGRGVPTGWNCPLIFSPMNPPETPMVWQAAGGSVQGELIEPLYARCQDAALKDSELYELLSLIDILRTGKPRELVYAKDLMHDSVMGLHA